jgi:glycosyltransferase involved in cell wall biosynthesis
MGVTKHFIGSSLVSKEELSDLLTTEITYSSVNKLPKVKFFRFFNKPFKTEASFLNLRFINNLLKTFPPVWNYSIKGFDIFCNIAIKMLNNDDYFFVSAGIGEISAPFQKNFFDIGWTDDPASLINISDVVIVPNRDTYFDLGIIQTLSLNKPIITTDTGGNSWFKDKDINLFFASSTSPLATEPPSFFSSSAFNLSISFKLS